MSERERDGYRTPRSPLLTEERTAVLRALVDLLLPGVPDHVDLVAFVDGHIGAPLGRGDRPVGVGPEPELFDAALGALARAGFSAMDLEAQTALVGRMRRGEEDAVLGVAAREFVDRLLDKALAGYLGHPGTWSRIGFAGPAFPEGYAWIGPAEVLARRRRAAGWEHL